MTVKELKEKLEILPENLPVTFFDGEWDGLVEIESVHIILSGTVNCNYTKYTTPETVVELKSY